MLKSSFTGNSDFYIDDLYFEDIDFGDEGYNPGSIWDREGWIVTTNISSLRIVISMFVNLKIITKGQKENFK